MIASMDVQTRQTSMGTKLTSKGETKLTVLNLTSRKENLHQGEKKRKLSALLSLFL